MPAFVSSLSRMPVRSFRSKRISGLLAVTAVFAVTFGGAAIMTSRVSAQDATAIGAQADSDVSTSEFFGPLSGEPSTSLPSEPTTSKVPGAGESHEGHGHEGHSHDAPAPEAPLHDDPEQLKMALKTLPEEIQPDAQKAWDRYKTLDKELEAAMLDLRRIQIHYRNGYDQTPSAVIEYREQRNKTWNLMQEQFVAALDLMRYLPSVEAVSYVVTMVQHHFENDIYDEHTYEAAARLLDIGQNFRFLFLALGRSAVVTGRFDTAKQVYESLTEEDLEKADKMLLYQLDKLEEQFKQEQEAIAKTDPDKLPQVRFETTKGDFVVELFPDAAPSAVAHFLKLVEDGFYDGMDFSVVSENVLALSGDVSGDGRGNAGQFLVDEHGREGSRPGLRGSLAMAKIPLGNGEFVENSGSSQFAILYLPIVAIASNQTIFGRVIDGMDNVSRLRRVDPTEKKEKNQIQLPPDAILSAEIIRRGEELPEPVYVDMRAEIEKAVKAGLIKSKQPSGP
ncbi:peptidylprolyl isomerase [Aporhodopirellula aestuarii]|uniref:peptidylprolyl isomerase n=1 Tax=Aporhodopirellula aestuarii TaxID=2950107 RepID=A0ABT0UC16_9BACT|nr:peptidylprolyl isomerase [Aporhodopirellula aestuarii]MCM2374035.1 peptidylprolyl isomerase [Aporhodopirellula aestuarii]